MIFETPIKNSIFNSKITLKQLSILTTEFSKFLMARHSQKQIKQNFQRTSHSRKILILMAVNSILVNDFQSRNPAKFSTRKNEF